MYVIDGILDDTWCETEEQFINVLTAFKPMLTSLLAAQISNYLNSNAPKNPACVSAIKKVLGKYVDMYDSARKVFSLKLMDAAYGVNYRDLYAYACTNHTSTGFTLNELRDCCKQLAACDYVGISSKVVTTSNDVENYKYVVAENCKPDISPAPTEYIKANKSALLVGDINNQLRMLKNVTNDIKWTVKCLDYIDLPGMEPSSTCIDGSVFNFARA